MWKKTLIVALCLGGCGGSSSEPDDIATGADGGFTPDVAAGADQASDPSAGDAISSMDVQPAQPDTMLPMETMPMPMPMPDAAPPPQMDAMPDSPPPVDMAPPPPQCRNSGQACAATADCCQQLVCISNTCLTPPAPDAATPDTAPPPPQCRPSGQACAATADCCQQLVCIANTCQVAPTCGDGVCSPGETSSACCGDCGCQAGSYCSQQTKSCVAASFTMTWKFSHRCAKSGTIAIRLFDVTHGWVWPSRNDAYLLPAGTDRQASILCTGGGKICGGARDADGRYWGVDLDNSEDCSGCCYICGATAETPTLNLLCN